MTFIGLPLELSFALATFTIYQKKGQVGDSGDGGDGV